MSDSNKPTLVIVGAGQAGGEIATQLHKLGHEGRTVMISEESYVPYRRPPLSKAYLAGEMQQKALFLMQPEKMEKIGVEVITNTRVERIDRAAKTLTLSNGDTLAYDKLALTTGSRARPLPLPGADSPNVFALRGIDDIDAIRAQAQPGKKVTIIGGGFIGLETAAVLCKMGLQVTVLEGLPRVLARVTVPEISSFFERIHRKAGVDLRVDAQVAALKGTPNITQIELGDGSTIDTDFVIIGIGIIPNVELAQEAGLDVDNGILVDEYTQTSDPDIVSAGDCTNHPNAFLGRRLRLESVQNAMEQGRAAAYAMLDQPKAYEAVPWFWSDQYDIKLQMVGMSAGFDQMVIRGNPETERHFAVFYLREGRLISADTLSQPREFMIAKKLVAAQVTVDPQQLADENVPLKDLLPEA